jgi:hypothetical protein
MFALGHKRTLRQVNAMSALPPKSGKAYLFDHFVGALLELQGYLDALGFRCLKLIIK